MREVGSILKNCEFPFYTGLGAFFCTAAAMVTLWKGLSAGMLIPVLFCILLWWLLLRSCNQRDRLLKLCVSSGFFFLFCTPICILISIYGYRTPEGIQDGPILFFFLILCTKIGDIGAYVFGTLSSVLMKGGNHKAVPSVSPGKSYEGCAGGLICTIVLCYLLWPHCGLELYDRWISLPLGIVLYFGGAIGDLAESSFKRTCKVKDSGHTLPGIGGILDLVDSLMINSMIFWIFLKHVLHMTLE